MTSIAAAPKNAHPFKAAANRASAALTPLQHAKWNLAVTGELAEPVRMTLSPVRDAMGQIIDFQWSGLMPSALLMRGRPGPGKGDRLSDFFPDRQGSPSLFEAYQHVFLTGTSEAVPIDTGEVRSMHHVSGSALGVAVVVTNTSAMERLRAAQHTLQVLEATHAGLKTIRASCLEGPRRIAALLRGLSRASSVTRYDSGAAEFPTDSLSLHRNATTRHCAETK